jgi:homoserine O-acetyltransferase
VDAGSVDWIGSYWQAPDGDMSIDMSGAGPGTLSQTFDTTIGNTYTVSFLLSGNPGGPASKTLDVSATGGTLTGYTHDTTGTDVTSMVWTPETYSFLATSPSTTLSFISTTAGASGPAIDAVAITESVPVKDDCKDGGWQSMIDNAGNSFKNQGDCVSYFATKGKNLGALPPVVVADATTWRLGPQAIAFNEVGRRAILEDPHFAGGDYYGAAAQPESGLSIARMVGHITYLSDESMHEKFGRRLQKSEQYAYDFVSEFQVESYLAHQGRRFVERFDANTYLLMTKAMDYFDLQGDAPSLAAALKGVDARFLVLSFSSDWLFPTARSRELVAALKENGNEVTFAEIPSPYGHDAFLLEPEEQHRLIAPFLRNSLARSRASATEAIS